MEYKGIHYLRKKLNALKGRVDLRYSHYAMQHIETDFGVTIPPSIKQQYKAVLGWCAKGVDSLADRLVFREFANDLFQANDIFEQNNPDVFFDNVVLSTLIASCCFVYISLDQSDSVRLQVIEASNGTGIINPINGLLEEGYAVLQRDERGQPRLEAYFTKEATIFIHKDGKEEVFANPTGVPLLVPIIHRPDAVRPFGRSRITRAGMYYQSYAKRALERSDVTAEFYSFPQKYVLGTSPDAEPMDKWKATITSLLEFTKDEDGDKPSIGQFTTSNMTPFTEQLRTAAAGFAGEMGLTLDDLGFVSDNPSSVEAIKASHENLRLAGRKAQRSIGSGLLNVAYVACCLRDNFAYLREQFIKTVPKWEPLFEADATTLTMLGDGVIKINQALPGYITAQTIRDLTGIVGDSEAKPAIPEVSVDEG